MHNLFFGDSVFGPGELASASVDVSVHPASFSGLPLDLQQPSAVSAGGTALNDAPEAPPRGGSEQATADSLPPAKAVDVRQQTDGPEEFRIL